MIRAAPLALVLVLTGPPLRAQPDAQLAAEAEAFQARIEEVARALRGEPRLRRLSEKKRLALTEFVVGNTLFVLLHELAHALITDLGLPVLGREEDAADAFAVVTLLKVGGSFSQRVLVEAAKGWFLSDLRDQADGEPIAYYDEHGLGAQRAYFIVCLMVGSVPQRFKDLARETKLPQERQETCQADYSNASWSWEMLLKPHRRAPDQPKTRIDVVYGDGSGRYDVYVRAVRSLRLLETVAEHAADAFGWRAPLTLEMRKCGESDAHWSTAARKVTVCYEMAAEFAQLYFDYGHVRLAILPRRRC